MAKQSCSRYHQVRVSRVQKVRKIGPGCISNTSIEGLSKIERLKKDLRLKKNIVIISGAGISTNAGGKSQTQSFPPEGYPNAAIVDDFHSFSRTRLSSRILFHSSAYRVPGRAAQLHNQLLAIFKSASTSGLTSFDHLMEAWAHSGRVRRHYTQNIDCRSDRLPSLSQRTIMLHGRVDMLTCSIRPQHTFRVTAESFSQLVNERCPICEKEQTQRELEGKRRRSTGTLRSNVLLYGECSPEESEILAAFNKDLYHPVDAVILVGTRLEIGDLRDFVEKLCDKARPGNKECLTVWVNREPPKLRGGFEMDYQFLGDCDKFALAVSA